MDKIAVGSFVVANIASLAFVVSREITKRHPIKNHGWVKGSFEIAKTTGNVLLCGTGGAVIWAGLTTLASGATAGAAPAPLALGIFGAIGFYSGASQFDKIYPTTPAKHKQNLSVTSKTVTP